MVSSLFICHGAPTLALENNEYTNFIKNLGKSMNPKAIVIFTAHWEEDVTTISAVDNTYDMIYDFYGFQKELYEIKYEAKGSIEIASKLQGLLENHKIKSRLDKKRGLDHGSWVILRMMYPEANIPVIQVSVNSTLTMEEQYKIGEALKSLGEEEILVIGSGATVHNLSTINWRAEKPEAWAVEFDDWLMAKIENKDVKALFSYEELAPYGKKAVPNKEHFAPLFIAMGSGENKNTPRVLYRGYEYGTLSYIALEF